MPLISLLLFATSVALARSPAVQQTVLCARYLDSVDLAGDVLIPARAQAYVDSVITKLVENAERTEESLAPRSLWQTVKDKFADRRVDSKRFVGEDLAAPAADHRELDRRARVISGLRELRDLILVSSDSTAPVRRLTEGGARIVGLLTHIKERARLDQDELERAYDARAEILAETREAGRAERRAQTAKLTDKLRAAGAESRWAKYFGPESDLSKPKKALVLAGYVKKAFGVSALLSFISPTLVPVTGAVFFFGWFAVKRWIYFGAEHGEVFVRGFFRERGAKRNIGKLERFRRDVARSEHQMADLDKLIELTERRVPNAVASFTYDVEIAMGKKTPEFSEILNGSIIRTAAEKAPFAGRGRRLVRVHHVFSTDESGEPKLATNLIERTKLPRSVRAWASTFVLAVLKR